MIEYDRPARGKSMSFVSKNDSGSRLHLPCLIRQTVTVVVGTALPASASVWQAASTMQRRSNRVPACLPARLLARSPACPLVVPFCSSTVVSQLACFLGPRFCSPAWKRVGFQNRDTSTHICTASGQAMKLSISRSKDANKRVSERKPEEEWIHFKDSIESRGAFCASALVRNAR